jgi:hypothetical protein
MTREKELTPNLGRRCFELQIELASERVTALERLALLRRKTVQELLLEAVERFIEREI